MAASPSKQATTIKSEEKKRRTVFRQLLETPFSLTWYLSLYSLGTNERKYLDQNTNDDILNTLCRYSNILQNFYVSLLAPLASYRPQHTINISRKRKRRKSARSLDQHPLFVNPPPLVSFITIGFNPTTQHLESEVQNTISRHMRAIFVARGDTSSNHLHAHFPLLASMLPNVRLVSLAKGAEARLCETLQLKRVTVIGILVACLFGIKVTAG
jgi:hypothetical protein